MVCPGIFRVLALSHTYSSTDFPNFVAAPRVAYYDNPDWVNHAEKPASRTAFTPMCHIDPGRDKYGKQPQSLRRLLLLSWMATFRVGEYTLDDIANHLGQECREESCLRIIERYNQEAKGLIDEIEHV